MASTSHAPRALPGAVVPPTDEPPHDSPRTTAVGVSPVARPAGATPVGRQPAALPIELRDGWHELPVPSSPLSPAHLQRSRRRASPDGAADLVPVSPVRVGEAAVRRAVRRAAAALVRSHEARASNPRSRINPDGTLVFDSPEAVFRPSLRAARSPADSGLSPITHRPLGVGDAASGSPPDLSADPALTNPATARADAAVISPVTDIPAESAAGRRAQVRAAWAVATRAASRARAAARRDPASVEHAAGAPSTTLARRVSLLTRRGRKHLAAEYEQRCGEIQADAERRAVPRRKKAAAAAVAAAAVPGAGAHAPFATDEDDPLAESPDRAAAQRRPQTTGRYRLQRAVTVAPVRRRPGTAVGDGDLRTGSLHSPPRPPRTARARVKTRPHDHRTDELLVGLGPKTFRPPRSEHVVRAPSPGEPPRPVPPGSATAAFFGTIGMRLPAWESTYQQQCTQRPVLWVRSGGDYRSGHTRSQRRHYGMGGDQAKMSLQWQ